MPGVAVESNLSRIDDPWISSTTQSLRRVFHPWNNRTACDLLSSSAFFGSLHHNMPRLDICYTIEISIDQYSMKSILLSNSTFGFPASSSS
jgi:hypothetical protein